MQRLEDLIVGPFYTVREAPKLVGVSQAKLRAAVGQDLTVYFFAPDGKPQAKPRYWVRLPDLDSWLRKHLERR
jgi:hypothetical protein